MSTEWAGVRGAVGEGEEAGEWEEMQHQALFEGCVEALEKGLLEVVAIVIAAFGRLIICI